MRNIRACICIIVLLIFAHGPSIAQSRDSLAIKIGQMILIGVPGTRVDSTVWQEIRDGKAGSIIFFEKNIAAKNSYAALRQMTWAYQAAAPIPLFISIDQEGGKVNRLKEKYGFPRSITAVGMGRSVDSVRYYGQTTAATLAGLGINVNFAPVVDVAVNPANPVIAKVERSFSAHPDTVTRYATEFVKTHRQVGVITVLKHFPGHGSSRDDTHLGMADVTDTWSERELIPYQQMIRSGYTDAVMTAHIVNRNIDHRGLPGTLSERMIDSLLRKTLQYDGVVFSDDMQMHAITHHYGLEEAIRLAINAGVDILTFSNNIQGSEDRTVDRVHAIVRKLVETGEVPESRINRSFERIMRLKGKLILSRDEWNREEMEEAKAEIFKLRQENDRLQKQLTDQAADTLIVPVQKKIKTRKRRN